MQSREQAPDQQRSTSCCAASAERGRVRDTSAGSLLRSLRLLAFGVALGRACQDLFGDQAGVLADRRLDLRGHVGIGLEERLRVLAALAQSLAVIGEPGGGSLDDRSE